MWRRVAAAAVIVAILATGFHFLAGLDHRLAPWSGLKAFLYYFAGLYSEAAAAYRSNLEEQARRLVGVARSAPVSLAAGDLEGARSLANQELKTNPGSTDALLTLGEVALAEGDNAGALRLFRRVLELKTDQYDALLLASVAHARRREYDDALVVLNRALRYPGAEDRYTAFLTTLDEVGRLTSLSGGERPLCLLANYHRYLRIYDSSQARVAIHYANAAINLGNRADFAYVVLGVIYKMQGKRTRSLEAFVKGIESNPRNTAALLGAARHQQDRGDLASAFRYTSAAFEATPDDPYVATNLHAFYTERVGDYQQALALNQRIVATKPERGEAWWRLGIVYAYLGDHEQALASYNAAMERGPATPDLYDGVGWSLYQLDRKEEAFKAWTASVAMDPSRSLPHFMLAQLHVEALRWREAVREYETGFLLGRGDVHRLVGLCGAYWELQEVQRAQACLKHALTWDPDNMAALGLLEHVGKATSRPAKTS